MIVYNSPEHAKQRQEVEPPPTEHIAALVFVLNQFIPKNSIDARNMLQRLIFDYENLSHMREYSQKWINVNDALPSDDSLILVWLCNNINPIWKGYAIGTYQDGNWYLNGGISDGDYITYWSILPEPPKTK